MLTNNEAINNRLKAKLLKLTEYLDGWHIPFGTKKCLRQYTKFRIHKSVIGPTVYYTTETRSETAKTINTRHLRPHTTYVQKKKSIKENMQTDNTTSGKKQGISDKDAEWV